MASSAIYAIPGFSDPVSSLILGVGACTAEAVLELLRYSVVLPAVVGPHELFHFGVLAGAAFHWQFVSQFAAGEV